MLFHYGAVQHTQVYTAVESVEKYIMSKQYVTSIGLKRVINYISRNNIMIIRHNNT